ncbi:uncharacterized protein LOC116175859 isoform X2 [Photinus pyralis]|uniref:uncharacterized protein LOC116175859 isoform X2 n=1 Tax=Photinus pyralis TaxID=7054 RepID=UPI0012677AF2|nr:uncharacterized protein LOC116175859 isoform X2 [Photinus pyralis]
MPNMFNTVGEYLVIFIAITVITFIKLLITPEGTPIFNVYRTPSSLHWLKTGVMFIILSIQKLQRMLASTSIEYENLETPQLLAHDNAIDFVYFTACNAEGDNFTASIARRSSSLADAHLFLKLPSSSLGLMEHPNTPSTTFSTDKSEFHAEGLKMISVTPVKKWKITYDGKMRATADSSRLYSIQIYLTFRSTSAISLEPWSVEYFQLLNKKDRLHYGQFGELSGKIVIEGKEYTLSMDAIRYRSYDANWNWAVVHRSVVHYLTAENGDRFIIGKESMPITLSNLTWGFVYCVREKKTYPLQGCNFELYQHGEEEEPPMDYAFICSAGNRQYAIQIKVEQSSVCYVSKEWECKVIERICNAEIDGKRGWGTSRWLYRNVYGKS